MAWSRVAGASRVSLEGTASISPRLVRVWAARLDSPSRAAAEGTALKSKARTQSREKSLFFMG